MSDLTPRPAVQIPRCLVPILLILICSEGDTTQVQTKKRPDCDAPQYFGICDTFVPGTFISGRDREPMYVHGTWPDGPAERAGICAGDQIISVNALRSSENTFSRMLREFVSDAPNSVLLRVLRGNKELEFVVPRVRESTLAYLSNRKFLRKQLVPLAQTTEGINEFESFRERVMAAAGYKPAGMEWVPLSIPNAQVQRFAELIENITNSERIQEASFTSVTTRIFESRDGCSPGFTALVLRNPDEVWVRTIIPGSPAHNAGLFPGDQVIKINGKPVRGMTKTEIESSLLQPDVPHALKLSIRRNGRSLNITLKTEKFHNFEPHSSSPQALADNRPPTGSNLVVGLSVLYSGNPREAMVQYVEYPSPAFDAKLLIGDRLLRVNGISIESLSHDQLQQFLAPNQSTEITFEVSRGRNPLTFHVVPMAYQDVLARIGRKLTKFGSAPSHCFQEQE